MTTVTPLLVLVFAFSIIFAIVAALLKFPSVYFTFGPAKGRGANKWAGKMNKASAWFGWTAAVLFSFFFGCRNLLSKEQFMDLSKVEAGEWLICIAAALAFLLFIVILRYFPLMSFPRNNCGGDDGGGGGWQDGPIVFGGPGAYKAGFDYMQGIEHADPANSWKYQNQTHRN